MKKIDVYLILLLICSLSLYSCSNSEKISKSTDLAVSSTEVNMGGGCTRDALQCPNGTIVGRVPPKCEFAICPK